MVVPTQRRRRVRRAGRAAHERYEAEVKAWRRRHRRFFWSLTAVVAAVTLASVLVLGTRDVPAWTGGVVVGMAIAFWIVVRDAPPAWIENHRRGGWGEERTARVLEPLTRRGWTVLHDLRWDRGNLDHVLIGPGGVFVLDTKNWHGEARVHGGELWVRSSASEREQQRNSAGRAARGQAAQLHDWLQLRGAGRHWVHATVVLWTDFEQRVATGPHVTFVHGDQLTAWLDEQPPKLSAARVADISSRLQAGQRRAVKTDREPELADAPATS